YHYLRGGSERAYFDTARILAEQGNEVAFFSTKNPKNLPTVWSKYFVDAPDFADPSIGWLEKIKITFRLFYNFQAKRNLKKLIKEFQPDVAHLHNIYHHLSPSIIDTLKENKVPTVMTLHDYKLISPNYNLFARGKIWEASKPNKYWRCFSNRCVGDSYPKSLIAALESYFHQWLGVYEKINAFISPSNFLIKKFREFGFQEKISYLPNPFFLPKMADESAISEKYILYYGRLSEEKGVEDLLAAYEKINSDVVLKFVGDGPEREKLGKKSKASGKKIIFTGRLAGEELWRQVAKAELIVIPSRWFENAAYSAIEPMALGKIVLAASIGGLTELIQDGVTGFLFPSGNIDVLQQKIEYILAHPELKMAVGPRAAEKIAQKNNPKIYYNSLLNIYRRAIAAAVKIE
ncbi:MAG: glycosyltransferase family 4 protein, partial [Patescibacteria group bacterium]|nr:glycosyltransferase family 4 protein [Patescibacteria group bacterium]